MLASSAGLRYLSFTSVTGTFSTLSIVTESLSHNLRVARSDHDHTTGPATYMNLNENALFCWCGRSFSESGPLKSHQNSCQKNKRRLSGALAKAKELWTKRKRRRLEDLTGPGSGQSFPDELRVVDIEPAELVIEAPVNVVVVRLFSKWPYTFP